MFFSLLIMFFSLLICFFSLLICFFSSNLVFFSSYLVLCHRVHNAMLALRKIVKRFEFKPKTARGPLLAVMRVTMPLLKAMSHQLIGDESVEAGQVRYDCVYGILVVDAPFALYSLAT